MHHDHVFGAIARRNPRLPYLVVWLAALGLAYAFWYVVLPAPAPGCRTISPARGGSTRDPYLNPGMAFLYGPPIISFVIGMWSALGFRGVVARLAGLLAAALVALATGGAGVFAIVSLFPCRC
jgi:hypothetical protein